MTDQINTTATPLRVVVTENNTAFSRTITARTHSFPADEPLDAGGTDLGPNPYEILLGALGACTSMTVRMYANRKQLPLDSIEVSLSHRRIDAADCPDCQTQTGLVDVIEKEIRLQGNLTGEQRDKLIEISAKCPVQKTLLNEILIKTRLSGTP